MNNIAGGQSHCMADCPTKRAMLVADIQADHLDVPAFSKMNCCLLLVFCVLVFPTAAECVSVRGASEP